VSRNVYLRSSLPQVICPRIAAGSALSPQPGRRLKGYLYHSVSLCARPERPFRAVWLYSGRVHRQETAALNQHALAQQIRQRQLKQWWLADQIGVDKRTVNRWLTGRVTRISLSNLARLASLLQCPSDDLVLEDETDTRATQAEQSEAARLLLDQKTHAMFAHRGEYAVYESLLKAVMHPNMGIQELCDIYARLSVAVSGQGKSELSRRYAELSRDYAQRCGNQQAELSARNNIIAAEGELGRLAEARAALEELASAAESVGNARSQAVAQVNLTLACRLQGDMPAAIRAANHALAYFSEYGDAASLLVSYNQASLLALDIGRLKLARQLRSAPGVDDSAWSPRARLRAAVFCAELDSLEGRHSSALNQLAESQSAFGDLPQLGEGEGAAPARILRRCGRLGEAEAYLQRLQSSDKLNIYDPPFISEEGARLALAQGNHAEAVRLRQQANKQFTALGMPKRVCEDPGIEVGCQFKAKGPLGQSMASCRD
jgi:DNA-binding Xre family transcriptional regulator